MSSLTTFLSTSFQSLSTYINPYHSLEIRIGEIAQQSLDSLTKDQKRDLQDGFKLAHRWIWPAGRMRELLLKIPKNTITVFVNDLLASETSKEIEYFLPWCIDFFEEKSLLELSGFTDSKTACESFQIHALSKSTFLENSLEKEGKTIWKEFLVELKYFVYQILELMISLLGLNDIMRQKGYRGYSNENLDSTEANSKLEIYLKLIAYPATLFGIIYYYIKYKTPAILLTVIIILALLIFLVAYKRYWQPCPIDHPGLVNLSIESLSGEKFYYPRRDILRQIEKAFGSQKGVILVGKPGSGKSYIAHSFAEQVTAGKICSFIKNPQVFTGNAANFNSLIDSNSFGFIEEHFKNHSDQVVFFFDEFHSFFKQVNPTDSTQPQADSNQLGVNATDVLIKTFFDKFNYIIGATTEEEFKKYIDKKGIRETIINRRFLVISVDQMDRDEIEIILTMYLESKNSRIIFDPEVVSYIIDKAQEFNPQTSQIDAAQSLLKCAIEKMTLPGYCELEEKIEKLKQEKVLLEQRLISGEKVLNFSYMNGLKDQLLIKNKEITAATNELNGKKLQTKHMQEIEDYCLKLKKECYKLANENLDLSKNPALMQKWLKMHSLINILTKFIKEERKKLGLPFCIDKSLIDSILEESEK